MTEKEAKRLFEKYREGTCTPEERKRVEDWYLSAMKRWPGADLAPADIEMEQQAVFSRLQATFFTDKEHDTEVRPNRRTRIGYWSAAAAVFIAITAGWLVYNHRQTNTVIDAAQILPGGNRATLTLADGRVINLDEAQTGIVISDEDIAYQDGISLGLSPFGGGRDGSSDGRGRFDEIEELVLTTPRGGTYQVTLPDGSKVWLNANTTLKYPSRFSGSERMVELSGEAYFDIESAVSPFGGGRDGNGVGRGRLPFLVKTTNQTVEVLGTQFNISAYASDDETKTTLVTGRVRVGVSPFGGGREGSSDGRGRILELKPGEQSSTVGSGITVSTVDLEQYTAWKDGYFKFDGDLHSIMQQVSRWYDLEIVYEDESMKEQQIYGLVDRNRPFADVLSILEAASNAKFKVTGYGKERRVTVMR